MALLNQDFTKFQKDSFQIRFTITDATTSLLNYEGWWGCFGTTPQDYPGDATAPVDTPVIEKATAGWTTGAAGTGLTMGSNYVIVTLTQSDFNGNSITGKLEEGTYYHELVIGNSDNGSDSVVVATGTMTISPSLFTNNEYRWV
jgi:hypothetical protein